MISVSSSNISRALRLGVAAVGGYVFTTVSMACISTFLPWLGMDKTEAASLSGMLGLLIYLTVIICVLVSENVFRLCLSLTIGAVWMALIAVKISRDIQ